MATSSDSGGSQALAAQHSESIVKSSTALSVVSLISVATSFLWDVAIATRFGISARSDAFYFAYTLPSILTSLIYLAAYSILVPAVSRRLGAGEQEGAWRLFSSVVNVVLLLTLIVSVVGAVSSYALVAVLAPGFGGQTSDVAAQMSIILFASLPAAVGFEVLRTGLYSVNRLVAPTVLMVLFNLTIVGFVFVGGPFIGVRAAALGVAAGKIGEVAIIAIMLSRIKGFRYHFSLQLKDPEVKDMLRGFLSPMSGMGARRVVLVLERLIASTLPAGSLTALSLGNRLGTVVGTVYYDSVTTALLPALSVQIWQRRWEHVRQSLLAGIRLVSFISLPAVIVLVILRGPITNLMFEHGLVTDKAAGLTASVLAIYACSLLPMGHFRVLQNYFYAAKKRGLVVVLFGLAAVSNLILDVVLFSLWGARGIAAAFAMSSVLVMIVGYVLMWPKVGGWPVRELSGFAARSFAAGLLCAATVLTVRAAWPDSSDLETTWSRALFVSVAGGGGVLVYFAASLFFQPEEARRSLSLVKRRFQQRRVRLAEGPALLAAEAPASGSVSVESAAKMELAPATVRSELTPNQAEDSVPVFRPVRRPMRDTREPFVPNRSTSGRPITSSDGEIRLGG